MRYRHADLFVRYRVLEFDDLFAPVLRFFCRVQAFSQIYDPFRVECQLILAVTQCSEYALSAFAQAIECVHRHDVVPEDEISCALQAAYALLALLVLAHEIDRLLGRLGYGTGESVRQEIVNVRDA